MAGFFFNEAVIFDFLLRAFRATIPARKDFLLFFLVSSRIVNPVPRNWERLR